MTPLIGRDGALAAVTRAIDEGARLVTITGPAGAGKSRLAIEVALGKDAAARADVSEVTRREALIDAIALAIGAEGGALDKALASRGELVVVLDDADRAIDALRAAIPPLLHAAPELVIVVTSRERLAIEGEAIVELGPLDLPSDRAEPKSGAIEASAAVALFVAAARRVRSDYALTEAEAPFVAALVRELDGLPLAIELAASRMAVMGARALLHRMASRFEVLRKSGAARGRHATLEAAIEASWIALAPHEQDALAQCAVFRGGFSLEAAERVIDVSRHKGAPPVMAILEALRDKSLLFAMTDHHVPGELRLGIYASVRDFAMRSLSAEDKRAVELRHADAVVAEAELLSKRASKQASGKTAREARARVLADRENLLAVIERVLGKGPVTARAAEPALRALVVLAPAMLYEGPLEALVSLIDPALAATRDSGADPRLSANALAVRGALLRKRGKIRAASRDLVQALAIARTLGDQGIEAKVTIELGHALAGSGDVAGALDHYERAERMLRALGDRSASADAMQSMGALLLRQTRLEEAAPLLARALAIHRAEESPVAEVMDHNLLAELSIDAGRLDDARAQLEGSARAGQGVGDKPGEAIAKGLYGLLAALSGDGESAHKALEEASATLRDLGYLPLSAAMSGKVGLVSLLAGKTAEAFALFSDAIDDLGDEGDARGITALLAHKAALEAIVGRAASARALLDAAHDRSVKAGDPVSLALVAIARAHLDRGGEGDDLAKARAIAARSAEVRLALTTLDRAATERRASIMPPPDDALLVGDKGLWFRAPESARVPLDRRRPLALILDRLARARDERPGAEVTSDELLEAAWPGERVLPAAGAHRVRVAVATLRKLGLKDVIQTGEEGYRLSPAVPLARESG